MKSLHLFWVTNHWEGRKVIYIQAQQIITNDVVAIFQRIPSRVSDWVKFLDGFVVRCNRNHVTDHTASNLKKVKQPLRWRSFLKWTHFASEQAWGLVLWENGRVGINVTMFWPGSNQIDVGSNSCQFYLQTKWPVEGFYYSDIVDLQQREGFNFEQRFFRASPGILSHIQGLGEASSFNGNATKFGLHDNRYNVKWLHVCDAQSLGKALGKRIDYMVQRKEVRDLRCKKWATKAKEMCRQCDWTQHRV